MNRRSDQPMDPEAQALAQYMDQLVQRPSAPPPPADEIQAFAAALQQSVRPLTKQELANDPLLAKLLASQREYVESQSREILVAGDDRLRRTTVESERAALWADAARTGSSGPGTSPRPGHVQPASGWAGRLPTFSYVAAFALLSLVILSLFAITTLQDRRELGGVGQIEVTGTVTLGISNQDPSVVVDGIEIQIRDWEIRETVGSEDAQETPFRGAFVVLELVVVNSDDTPARVPFYGLLINDAQGTSWTVDVPATQANQAVEGGLDVVGGASLGSEPEIVHLVFDVPAAGSPYQMTNIEQTFSIPLVEP